MCGIVGALNLRDRGSRRSDVVAGMVGALRHRGPDESGIYVDDWIGLGHARLSIIDLSGGSQPIHNEDKSLWITYNGEVFNYRELREALVKRGHQFLTASDTEVILHLYEDKGPACVEDLIGQFAFAIWNARAQELFLARDRVGIRPLHYAIRGDDFFFASEIKAILATGQVQPAIDPVAMDQIFTFWTTCGERTIFQNVSEVPPGHWLKVSRHGRTLRRYWEIPYCPPEEQLDWPLPAICARIQELLRDAIRLRLRADVPVGSYLSGGLDSSLVSAIIKREFNSGLRTFGIRFEAGAFDEGGHQDFLASFLGTDHSCVRATNENIASSFAGAVWHCEKPLLRTAPIPLFLLSETVHASGLKVVLTGEGADEVFGGYNIFREAKLREFWSRFPDSRLRPLLVRRLYPYLFENSRGTLYLQKFFGQGLDLARHPLFSHLPRWENTARTKRFFAEELKAEIGDYCGYEEIQDGLPEGFAARSAFSRAQHLEMAIFLSNYLLSSQGDRMAMAHAVEIRLPYLDHRIIEFMARVPTKWKIWGLKEKFALKKSARGILPERTLERPKHPYRAPIKEALLNASGSEYAEEMLSPRSLRAAGLFDVGRVTGLVRKLRAVRGGSETDNMALAGIATTQAVFDQFVAATVRQPGPLTNLTVSFDHRSNRDLAATGPMGRPGARVAARSGREE